VISVALRLAPPVGALSIVAAAALSLVWLIAAALRPGPARVAILRQRLPRGFEEPLQRMIERELSPFGHIAVLGPARSAPTPILNARDYRRTALRLSDRIGLNLRAAPLPIIASAAWRPMALRLLVDSADAVIVDLSCTGESEPPELDIVRQAGAEARTVFVCIWGGLERAEAALRAAGFAHVCYHYAPDGEMQRRPYFRAAMVNAMRAAHGLTS
jgi:hypothetical protein